MNNSHLQAKVNTFSSEESATFLNNMINLEKFSAQSSNQNKTSSFFKYLLIVLLILLLSAFLSLFILYKNFNQPEKDSTPDFSTLKSNPDEYAKFIASLLDLNELKDPSPLTCSNHGYFSKGNCHCDVGFSGEKCEIINCPLNCSGNGKCTGEKCLCDGGYTGRSCSIKINSHFNSVVSLQPNLPKNPTSCQKFDFLRSFGDTENLENCILLSGKVVSSSGSPIKSKIHVEGKPNRYVYNTESGDFDLVVRKSKKINLVITSDEFGQITTDHVIDTKSDYFTLTKPITLQNAKSYCEVINSWELPKVFVTHEALDKTFLAEKFEIQNEPLLKFVYDASKSGTRKVKVNISAVNNVPQTLFAQLNIGLLVTLHAAGSEHNVLIQPQVSEVDIIWDGRDKFKNFQASSQEAEIRYRYLVPGCENFYKQESRKVLLGPVSEKGSLWGLDYHLSTKGSMVIEDQVLMVEERVDSLFYPGHHYREFF